ncbi:MAG: TIGR00180 family glycosyltransferase [Patescibacteria group bacterium]
MSSPFVAILIPTMNRSEFVIRQLKYYVQVGCPHPIYIGDSSNAAHDLAQREAIASLPSLTVHYFSFPNETIDVATYHLLENVTEEYMCMIGDDDFQIPSSLTRCAEFLESHRDYASAHGHAVALRIEGNKVAGRITKIKDYPQPQYEQESSAVRLMYYFSRYYVTLFSVHRTTAMHAHWAHREKIKDVSMGCEIIPCALSIIEGKSKLIDCLQFIRHIHDRNKPVPNYFDWVVQETFPPAYALFETLTTTALAEKDHLPADEAMRIVRKSFWNFLARQLNREYAEFHISPSIPSRGHWKVALVKKFPFLKILNRTFKKLLGRALPLHAAVTDPSTPYYQDFNDIRRSIERE